MYPLMYRVGDGRLPSVLEHPFGVAIVLPATSREPSFMRRPYGLFPSTRSRVAITSISYRICDRVRHLSPLVSACQNFLRLAQLQDSAHWNLLWPYSNEATSPARLGFIPPTVIHRNPARRSASQAPAKNLSFSLAANISDIPESAGRISRSSVHSLIIASFGTSRCHS